MSKHASTNTVSIVSVPQPALQRKDSHIDTELSLPSIHREPTLVTTLDDTASSKQELDRRQQQSQPLTSPPQIDGGYGWVIVAVSFLVLAFSSGLFQSFGVFAEAYLHREDAFPSASSGQVAFIGIAQVAIFCILSPITGYVCERVGFRPVMVLGGLMIGAGLILASFASAAGSLWMVTLGQGVITGIGAAATVNPARTLPSLWFTKKRGLATGIALCGGALGGVALSQIAEKIISSIGHRWALRAIGIICTFVVSSSSMLAYTPQQLGKVPIVDQQLGSSGKSPTAFQVLKRIFDFSLFRSRTFAGFVVYGTILYIAVYIPFQFLPSFAVRIGHLTPHFAANLESFANIGAIVGKIGGGYMADSIGVFNTNLLMSIISAISFFAVWLPFATAASTVAFSIVYGLASGAQLALLVVMLAKIYGTDRLPSISGLILFFGGIALLPSAPVAGVLVDKVGHGGTNYGPLIIYTGSLNVVILSAAAYVRFKQHNTNDSRRFLI